MVTTSSFWNIELPVGFLSWQDGMYLQYLFGDFIGRFAGSETELIKRGTRDTSNSHFSVDDPFQVLFAFFASASTALYSSK